MLKNIFFFCSLMCAFSATAGYQDSYNQTRTLFFAPSLVSSPPISQQWQNFFTKVKDNLVTEVANMLQKDQRLANALDQSCKTPLYYAVCNQSAAIVDLLLGAGADMHYTYLVGDRQFNIVQVALCTGVTSLRIYQQLMEIHPELADQPFFDYSSSYDFIEKRCGNNSQLRQVFAKHDAPMPEPCLVAQRRVTRKKSMPANRSWLQRCISRKAIFGSAAVICAVLFINEFKKSYKK